jgi:hypothetical protein
MARELRAGLPGEVVKTDASFGVALRVNSLNIRSEALQILVGHAPKSVRDLLVENKTRLLSANPQLRAN